ncbi:MAG: hypothetical protein ACFFDP_08820 [Promethearchaeota archaeon]
MSGSDKEAILIRVSEFLSKAVNDLADALTDIAKQVTEFKQSLEKIRGDLKTAQVTPIATSTIPLLSSEGTPAPSTGSLFDFLEGEEGSMPTTAEPEGLAEAILLGEMPGPELTTPPTGPPATPLTGPPTAPPKVPTTGPPKAPPTAPTTGPPTAPPKVPTTGPPKAPPTAPPAAMPMEPVSTPAVAAPVKPIEAPVASSSASSGEGIGSLRSEMLAEIKRIKEIFES